MKSKGGKDAAAKRGSSRSSRNAPTTSTANGDVTEKVRSRRSSGEVSRSSDVTKKKLHGGGVELAEGTEPPTTRTERVSSKGESNGRNNSRQERHRRDYIENDVEIASVDDDDDDDNMPGAVAVPAAGRSRQNARATRAPSLARPTESSATSSSVVQATPIDAELVTDPEEMDRLRVEKENLERRLQEALEQGGGNNEANIIQAEVIVSTDDKDEDDSAAARQSKKFRLRLGIALVVVAAAAIGLGMFFASSGGEKEPTNATTSVTTSPESPPSESNPTVAPVESPTVAPPVESSTPEEVAMTTDPSSNPTERPTDLPTNEPTSAPTKSPVTPQTPVEENPCDGKDPMVMPTSCVVDRVVNVGPQSPVNVTSGYNGGLPVAHVPITTSFLEAGLCPVNVQIRLGAEHYSFGEFDEAGTGPVDDELTNTNRLGYQCRHYSVGNPFFNTEYNWQHCIGMKVGQTYEVQWLHSKAGACGTPFQYQTPDMDGTFCRDGVLNFENIQQDIGVQAQVFIIINDSHFFWPDLFRGMLISEDKGVDLAMYTGSSTGTRYTNEVCSTYSPISYQVDRKCHLVSASTFDKMCEDMKAQADDMTQDLVPHGSRELVPNNLAANNHAN